MNKAYLRMVRKIRAKDGSLIESVLRAPYVVTDMNIVTYRSTAEEVKRSICASLPGWQFDVVLFVMPRS